MQHKIVSIRIGSSGFGSRKHQISSYESRNRNKKAHWNQDSSRRKHQNLQGLDQTFEWQTWTARRRQPQNQTVGLCLKDENEGQRGQKSIWKQIDWKQTQKEQRREQKWWPNRIDRYRQRTVESNKSQKKLAWVLRGQIWRSLTLF